MKLKTTLVWDDAEGWEHEAEVEVTYTAYPGYAGSQTEPPEDASVEITDIVRTGLGDAIGDDWDRWLEDEDLLAECMADWRDDLIAAAEYRAEARTDALMEDRWEREQGA